MLFESKLEQETVNSTSKIKVMSQDDQDVTVGVLYDNHLKLGNKLGVTAGDNMKAFSGLSSKRLIWALKNQMYHFDRANTNRLNIQIPLPLFFCDELLHFIGEFNKYPFEFKVVGIVHNGHIIYNDGMPYNWNVFNHSHGEMEPRKLKDMVGDYVNHHNLR